MSMGVLESNFIAHPTNLFFDSEDEKRPFSISFMAALALHAVLLFLGGMVFVSSPEYGIDFGRGGMEVYLVAAPLEMTKDETQSQKLTQNKIQEIQQNPGAEMAIPVPEKMKDTKNFEASQKESSILTAKASEHHGDGSSPVAGIDPTTFYSPGGAWMQDHAGHLKNPAPYYPQTAIELGQEGLVVVSVLVSREGRAKQIEIKEGSGFPLLDKSALTTIKKWKFNPGRAGFLTHEAWITIPVRFRLEDAQRSS